MDDADRARDRRRGRPGGGRCPRARPAVPRVARRWCVEGEASPPRLGRRHARRGVRGPFGGGGMEPRRPPRSIGGRRRSSARNQGAQRRVGPSVGRPGVRRRPARARALSRVGLDRHGRHRARGGRPDLDAGGRPPQPGGDLLVSNGVVHTTGGRRPLRQGTDGGGPHAAVSDASLAGLCAASTPVLLRLPPAAPRGMESLPEPASPTQSEREPDRTTIEEQP